MTCKVNSYTENNQGIAADQVLKSVLIPAANTYYRLSLFFWNPTNDGGAGIATFKIQWTQPFGGSANASVSLNLSGGPASQTIDMGIWVLAGTPIQYSVLGGTPYGNATYSYLLAIKDDSPDPENDESRGNQMVTICPPSCPSPPSCCGRCQSSPCSCNSQSGYYPYQPQQPIVVIPPRRMLYEQQRLLRDDDSCDWE